MAIVLALILLFLLFNYFCCMEGQCFNVFKLFFFYFSMLAGMLD